MVGPGTNPERHDSPTPPVREALAFRLLRWTIVVAILCVPIALVVGIVVLAIYLDRTEVKGTLHASGSTLGNWTLTPDVCESGERQGFFGISLSSKTDKRLGVTVVNDPVRGYVIVANIPDADKALSFERCEGLRGDVHRTGVKYNQYWDVSGSIDVACSTEEASITGHVEFRSCH